MVSVQPNMQGNDELSVLFSRNLTFNSETQTPRTEPSPVPAPSQPIVYSISQHYHHSAHAVKPKPQEQVLETPQEMQRPSSEPPQGGAAAVEHVLRTCGVDPTNLTPSQLQLFATADWPQQTRLIELWSICPPEQWGADSRTGMEQHVRAARRVPCTAALRESASHAFRHQSPGLFGTVSGRNLASKVKFGQ